ncbi:RNA polymerase-associated protein RapA [Oleiharenicola lentus]|uniref:RNA polymerase-associated protein RapA n=1 Tax=Oleiharenicola lentus TaxID=2508720 RepID=UPI003F66D7E0
MSLTVVGQRCVSEREPELGLGSVAEVDKSSKRITVEFPATNERRIYALGTPVLKRVQFSVGENVTTRTGESFSVESVDETEALLTYIGGGKRVREDAISDVTSVSLPQERLMAGQADPSEVFDLRLRALQAQSKFRQSDVRGFLGGRLQLIPHQFYILQEVTSRQLPRVLLADEVGLGKTIEACLILQRLLAVGKMKRALILVPESLTHQWFVELLRRFNLWFSIYDAERCNDLEASDAAQNPFLASQLVLASVSFLANDEKRRDHALAAGWDMVVVDEAHHLAWSPETPSAEYTLVEKLAQKTSGLLLLTATPTQLGLEGHFARLRLLDPSRYDDLASFKEESEEFGAVADIAEKIIESKPLKPKDHAALKKIFVSDPERLAEHLDALDQGKAGARDALLRTLLDQHGTGRVIFRNTRAAMTGFPKRKFCPVPIKETNLTQLARVARELAAEAAGTDSEVRYAFKEDARLDWLVEFLQKNKPAKVLLICKSQRKVAALEAALQEKTAIKIGYFHEGLQLVQRDRQAAWFAEPDGAQLLICSEIGSEGRNFQFAHHLVLWDLPLNPGLLEQRIGRLDRIGQTETIRVHAPYFGGSAEECIVEWYHRGLDAFETSLHGGNDYQEKFKSRLLEVAAEFADGDSKASRADLAKLVADTVQFREELSAKMERGRDRLLELNSFNPAVAAKIIERVRTVDADPLLRNFLIDLLDHFGVRIKEDENGDITLDPSHAYVDSFPSINADGMLATFKRERAIAREDISFISQDHALVQNAIDLLIDSKAGTTSFVQLEGDKPNLLLEAVFVLETVADSKWHVDQFLAPTPVRVLVDIHGKDLSFAPDRANLAKDIEDAPLPRFLARPGFNATLLKNLVEGASEFAAKHSLVLKKDARERAAAVLTADLQRLVDLSKLNDNVRPEEIELARKQVLQTRTAIEQARLRLDSLRLIVEGVPVA